MNNNLQKNTSLNVLVLLLMQYVAVMFIYILLYGLQKTVLVIKVINRCLLNNDDKLIWYI